MHGCGAFAEHHEDVGRARLPASMLPTLSRLLTLSRDDLIGLPDTALAARQRGGKRGLPSWPQQQIAAVSRRPKAEQQSRRHDNPNNAPAKGTAPKES